MDATFRDTSDQQAINPGSGAAGLQSGTSVDRRSSQASSEPIVEMRGISKTFGAVRALEGLDLAIRPGELVTVVGPSGCGKSTLFNILAGLEEPDQRDKLNFRGKPSTSSELLGKVAFMPQRDLLFPWRNVVENAILPLEVQGKSRSDAQKLALDMLPEFGLAGFEKQYPHQLSGGMRQRVALMRTFMFERDLMLLDEPFGALDALTRAMMQRWLLDVWAKHKRTVLFITHDVDEAIFLGDRILVMTSRPGRIKLEETVDLPRPRHPDVLTSAAFVDLKKKLLASIEEESMKAFAAGSRVKAD